MTSEERKMLMDLADKIQQTPPPARDPDADELIRTRIGLRPDVLYIMTQTVLIQNLALEHAQEEIQRLKEQQTQAQPQQPTSFLGGLLGSRAPRNPAPPPPPPDYYAPPPSAPVSGIGGASSFLRSAATTAAGVAAGALAFEGIRSLFSGPGGFGGFGMPHNEGILGGAPQETIVNNYYDSPGSASREEASDDRGGHAEYADYDDGKAQDTDELEDTDSSDADDSGDSGDDFV